MAHDRHGTGPAVSRGRGGRTTCTSGGGASWKPAWTYSAPDNSETELTVRAVCQQAGLTARYFYESFGDKDQFVAGVFDEAIAKMADHYSGRGGRVTSGREGTRGDGHGPDHRTDVAYRAFLFRSACRSGILRKRSELDRLFALLSGQPSARHLRRGMNPQRGRRTSWSGVSGKRSAHGSQAKSTGT